MIPEECESWNAPCDPDRPKLGDAGRLADAQRAFADDLPHERLLAMFREQREAAVAASTKSVTGASKNAGRKRKVTRSPVRRAFNAMGNRIRMKLKRPHRPVTPAAVKRAVVKELLRSLDQGRSEWLLDGAVLAIHGDTDILRDPNYAVGDEAGIVVEFNNRWGFIKLSTLLRYSTEK